MTLEQIILIVLSAMGGVTFYFFKEQMNSMKERIATLEKKRDSDIGGLYGETGEIKNQIMLLRVDLSREYVTKNDCEKRH